MANYSIVSNAQFRPFTYQELAAPLDRQDAYHEKLMEEYDKLSSQADVLEAMGANDRDNKSKTYGQYKAYSDALRSEAENLYRHGLNSESRMRLTDLRRRYNTEIVPIQNAWNKREEEAKMQQTASMSNPSLMFTRDARSTSLDEYIANPTGGFGVINRATITAQMAGMAKNLAKRIRNGEKVNVDSVTYDYIRKYGLDASKINDWIQNPNSIPELTNMMNQVLAANGVTADALKGSPNAAAITSAAIGAAQMGAWEAIGEDKAQLNQDYAKKAAIDDAYKAKEQARSFAYQAALKSMSSGGGDGDGDGDGNGNDGNGKGNGIYPFDTSTVQLPLTAADFSNSKEQAKALQTLGFVLKNGKYVPTGKTKITYSLDKDEVDTYNKKQYEKLNTLRKKVRAGNATQQEVTEMNTMERMLGRYGNFKSTTGAKATNEVSLYGKDGKIMTRKQFVAQAGNSKGAQKAYGEYFDKMVDAGKTLGIYGKMYTQKDVGKQYNALRKESAAGFANVHALNYEKSAWNPTSKSYMLQEITGYDKGKPIYNPKKVSLDYLLNKKDAASNEITVTPYWGTINGMEGLIIATTEDNKAHKYFISADEMPESNIQGNPDKSKLENWGARDWFFAAEKARLEGYEEEEKQYKANGLSALHRGLTLSNSPQTQKINTQLTNTQAGLTKK